MLRKLLYIYPEIIGYCKLLIYKFAFGRGLVIHGFPRFSCKSDIRMRKGSRLVLEDKCHIADHITLRLAGKGELIIKTGTSISQQTIITCHDKIEIGNNVMIGPNVTIYDHDHNFRKGVLMNHTGGYTTLPIVIEDNVWLGSNVIVLKGVRIGEGSVVASGSLVTKDIPAQSIVYNKRNVEIKVLD